MDNIITRIQEEVSTDFRDSETVREFIERIAREIEYDGDHEIVISAIEKQKFSAYPTLSTAELEGVEDFVQAIVQADFSGDANQSSSDDTPGVKKNHAPPSTDTSSRNTEPVDSKESTERNPQQPSFADRGSSRKTEYVSDDLPLRVSLPRPVAQLDTRLRDNIRKPYLGNLWWIIGIAIIGAYVYLSYLGHRPLVRWDESIYANVARNMVQNDRWVIPHVYIHPQRPGFELRAFLEKPPLVFWLQGISVSIFGITRFAIRLPIAIFAILSGLITYRFGEQLFDRPAGVASACVLFTIPMIYAQNHGGRTGSTDVPLLFFGSLFVYLTWTALDNDRPELLPYVGLVAGLALLTKGFHAGIFVIAVIPVVFYHSHTFMSRELVPMVGITAGITLPWTLYAWFRYGHQFVHEIFLQQVVQRATGETLIDQSGTTFSFMQYPYFQTFPDQIGVWFYFLFPAAAVALIRGWQKQSIKKPLFLIWWSVVTFGFFVFTGNHAWYIMPMFVPCSLIIGVAISGALEHDPVALVGIGMSVLAAIITVGLTLKSVVITAAAMLVVALPVADQLAKSQWRHDDYEIGRRIVPMLLAALIVASLVGSVPLGTGGPSYSGEEKLGQSAAKEVPEGVPVAVEPRMGKIWIFSFFAQRPITDGPPSALEGDDDIQFALVTNETSANLTRNFSIMAEHRDVKLIEFR
ncbi:glycosyltransferase family 39 protein [Haloarcula sp. H-GB4]|uniref:ArnT family glycosyltransferase n=1 Tax=Haloarcula sp. H-GB4 TaxID=3069755 RepID=UPI0027B1CFFC|nr:glycosyltransferase family 39 protein [Haloarcula sp. H-GB4]MDQ2072349.1 glycosyltransferase family 39 protein [Haloarcula sp. H-GB4]